MYCRLSFVWVLFAVYVQDIIMASDATVVEPSISSNRPELPENMHRIATISNDDTIQGPPKEPKQSHTGETVLIYQYVYMVAQSLAYNIRFLSCHLFFLLPLLRWDALWVGPSFHFIVSPGEI